MFIYDRMGLMRKLKDVQKNGEKQVDKLYSCGIVFYIYIQYPSLCR